MRVEYGYCGLIIVHTAESATSMQHVRTVRGIDNVIEKGPHLAKGLGSIILRARASTGKKDGEHALSPVDCPVLVPCSQLRGSDPRDASRSWNDLAERVWVG